MGPAVQPDFIPWWVRHQAALLRVTIVAGVVVVMIGAAHVVRSSQQDHPEPVVTPEATEVAPGEEDGAAGFDPLPEPGSSDWLAVHDEYPQTFETWKGEHESKIGDRTIFLQPIGEFDSSAPDPELLAEFVSIYFGVEAMSLPPIAIEELPDVTSRTRSEGFRQLLTPDILTALADQKSDDTDTLMGITMTDLYPEEEWNFVFGQASLVHGVGVMSFHRFDPENKLSRPARRGEAKQDAILRRSLNLLTHELGHTFGVQHCVFYHCVMNGSNNLAESDRSPLHACPVDLAKFEFATGFDRRERYLRLASWYRQQRFDDMADWALQRASELE